MVCHRVLKIMRRYHPHRGMTLIELLVAMGVISTLIALVLPAVQRAREAANRTQCQNNLRQLGIALHNYHDVHQTLPMGSSKQGVGCWGYAVTLLPFLEQRAAYETADFNQTDCCKYIRAQQTAVPRRPEPATSPACQFSMRPSCTDCPLLHEKVQTARLLVVINF